ncbi:MAG: metallophosphoesterase, partial [Bacteroidales bacterium]|nr:metallophosphoesterase [Bacteroidales bacterium]
MMNFKRVTYYIIAGLLLLFGACSKHPVTLCVLETSDLHGRFDPSAAGMAGYIRNVQEEYGSRLMLFDVGDYLQGTPAIYYSGHVDTTGKHLCAAFFDWFPYTAVTVGNHDIEAGMEVFSRVYRQTQVPVLSANIIRKSDGEPYFTPYQIFTVKGYRVAVLGLVTPHVSTWVAERLRPGLAFLSIEASAQYWVSYILENENPDLMIGLFHTGAEGGAGGPLGNENAALWIAENIPGIDLICYGHDHRPALHTVMNKNGDTVWLMNPGARGRAVARAEIKLFPDSRLKQVRAELVAVNDLPPDPEYMKDFDPYFKLATDYESKPIAHILHSMESNAVFS